MVYGRLHTLTNLDLSSRKEATKPDFICKVDPVVMDKVHSDIQHGKWSTQKGQNPVTNVANRERTAFDSLDTDDI